MLGMILAAAIYSCPIEIEWPRMIEVSVYYEHEGEDGRAYTYRAVQFLTAGVYDVIPEGHPCGIEWSDGPFCGLRAGLVFRDNFESGTTEKWDRIGG